MVSQRSAGESVEASAALTKQFVTDDWVDGLKWINILMGYLPFCVLHFQDGWLLQP